MTFCRNTKNMHTTSQLASQPATSQHPLTLVPFPPSPHPKHQEKPEKEEEKKGACMHRLTIFNHAQIPLLPLHHLLQIQQTPPQLFHLARVKIPRGGRRLRLPKPHDISLLSFRSLLFFIPSFCMYVCMYV